MIHYFKYTTEIVSRRALHNIFTLRNVNYNQPLLDRGDSVNPRSVRAHEHIGRSTQWRPKEASQYSPGTRQPSDGPFSRRAHHVRICFVLFFLFVVQTISHRILYAMMHELMSCR